MNNTLTREELEERVENIFKFSKDHTLDENVWLIMSHVQDYVNYVVGDTEEIDTKIK